MFLQHAFYICQHEAITERWDGDLQSQVVVLIRTEIAALTCLPSILCANKSPKPLQKACMATVADGI